MSAIPSAMTDGGGRASNFSVLYVILGGAALLTAVIFPIVVMLALRHFRRRALERQLLETPGVIAEDEPQLEEPKLFDVYVKPGLELREPTLDYIFPLTVRASSAPHAPPVPDALSTSPSTLRIHHQSRSRDREVYKAEAPAHDDGFQTYDVALLIAMPRPHPVDHWNELGEYVIGTSKTFSPTPLDNLL